MWFRGDTNSMSINSYYVDGFGPPADPPFRRPEQVDGDGSAGPDSGHVVTVETGKNAGKRREENRRSNRNEKKSEKKNPNFVIWDNKLCEIHFRNSMFIFILNLFSAINCTDFPCDALDYVLEDTRLSTLQKKLAKETNVTVAIGLARQITLGTGTKENRSYVRRSVEVISEAIVDVFHCGKHCEEVKEESAQALAMVRKPIGLDVYLINYLIWISRLVISLLNMNMLNITTGCGKNIVEQKRNLFR